MGNNTFKSGAALLLLLLAAANAFASDSTLTYSGGDLSGEFALNGDVSLQGRKEVLESVGFPGGLKVTHVGLPSYYASCTFVSRIGILAEAQTGKIGTGVTSEWDLATRFPSTLQPLDSVIDPSPQISKRPRFLGMGFVHSEEQVTSCRTIAVRTEPDYDRIVFFRNNAGIFIKLQIEKLLPHNGGCIPDTIQPCSHADKVLVRYHITDNPQGIFEETSAVEPVSRGAAQAAARRAYQGWDWVLGRSPRR